MSRSRKIRGGSGGPKRNRTLIMVAIIMGALMISLVLVLPSLRRSDSGTVTQVTPSSHSAPVNKTSLGNADAKVKMDVWEDFQCSACVFYTRNLEAQILQTYVDTGKVFYTFHFYPFIDGGQGESHDAANAAMCAAAQNRFWDYHDTLFANWQGENMGSFTRPRLTTFAQNIGLDMTAFNPCFQANTYSAHIQQDAEAGAKLGVPPTPGIFVNGKAVISSAGKDYIPSFDDISRAIETALAGP
ncbi:MAG TPA: thioredoxin domain-containing protein [Anaerolineales bacterium]|nr:thioredoxin domain-containing protein [Anaerolineales bacterium]